MKPAETSDNDLANVSTFLKQMAKTLPDKPAVVCYAGCDQNRPARLTFRQLDRESDRMAHGLETSGVKRGTRTILMVKPGLEFFILIFALFKTGAVPVVVDPGMGIRRMLDCLNESDPEAFIGIPLAHVLRTLFPRFFKSVHIWITVGRRWFWGGRTFKHLAKKPAEPYAIAKTRKDDMAAILFTTGSTGPAKGVVYTHGNFVAQLQQIKTHLGLSTDEVDLSTFPLFALFWPALGITSVIPEMDPTKPARVDPEKIITPICEQGVTSMFASPALLNRVGQYGKARGIRLPSLRRVISAGAPVSSSNIEQFASMLSENAQVHTPYGATEAVPIISIASREILSETRMLSDRGLGTCIGYPINDIPVRIIRISDTPVENWSDDLPVADGDVGEIVVKGDLVTRKYYNRPQADALAKINDHGDIWHRMGDLGRRDEKGRIWFYGRKSHRVITADGPLFTVPCEALFNHHPAVYRSALVGIGHLPQQLPLICIELNATGRTANKDRVKADLLEIAHANEMTRKIDTILFHKAFPVDIRHNSKIFREKLAIWAGKKIG